VSMHVTVEGNVGQDPEIHYANTGAAVCNVSVCCTPVKRDNVTGQWEDVGDPLWVRLSFWEKAGETVAETVHRGDRIAASGTLSIREYDTPSGERRCSIEIRSARFLGVQPRRPEGAPGQGAARPAPGRPQTSAGPQRQGSTVTFGDVMRRDATRNDAPPF